MSRADAVLENAELRLDQAIQAKQDEIDALSLNLGRARDELIALKADKADLASARGKLSRP